MSVDSGERALKDVQVNVNRASDGGCCEWSGSDRNGHYRIASPRATTRSRPNPPSLLRE